MQSLLQTSRASSRTMKSAYIRRFWGVCYVLRVPKKHPIWACFRGFLSYRVPVRVNRLPSHSPVRNRQRTDASYKRHNFLRRRWGGRRFFKASATERESLDANRPAMRKRNLEKPPNWMFLRYIVKRATCLEHALTWAHLVVFDVKPISNWMCSSFFLIEKASFAKLFKK